MKGHIRPRIRQRAQTTGQIQHPQLIPRIGILIRVELTLFGNGLTAERSFEHTLQLHVGRFVHAYGVNLIRQRVEQCQQLEQAISVLVAHPFHLIRAVFTLCAHPHKVGQSRTVVIAQTKGIVVHGQFGLESARQIQYHRTVHPRTSYHGPEHLIRLLDTQSHRRSSFETDI